MNKICDECETVAHCTKHGCIPKVSAKDAIKLALDHDAMRSALNALEARCGTNAEERGPTGAITLLNAALAEQPAPVQQEPVGVVNIESHSTHGWKVADFELTKALPFGRHLLYTSPPAQRKPLSVDEIFEAIRPLYSSDKAAWLAVNHSKDEYRLIEAKHGIKENT